MKKFDPVQVNVIWASCGALLPPCRVWMGGYVFNRDMGNGVVQVFAIRGTYKGCLINYAREAVRLLEET